MIMMMMMYDNDEKEGVWGDAPIDNRIYKYLDS